MIMASGETTNLRKFWDGLFGDQGTPQEAIAAAMQLPSPPQDEVAISDPAFWVIESFAIAQDDVYTRLIGPGAGPYQLDADYEHRAHVVADAQASLGGARLAKLINVALR